MNVDTSEFQAITVRLAAVEGTVAELAARAAREDEVDAMLHRAELGLPEPVRQARRRDRHGLRLLTKPPAGASVIPPMPGPPAGVTLNRHQSPEGSKS
jgi:hypothetical protein